MPRVSVRASVQPPQVAGLGTVLSPPFAIKFCMDFNDGSENNNNFLTDLSYVWAFVTLIDEHGYTHRDRLTGTVSSSAQTYDNSNPSVRQIRGYFIFDNLIIRAVGHYRLRITIVHMDANGDGTSNGFGATSLDSLESRVISVEDRDVGRYSPSELCRPSFPAFLTQGRLRGTRVSAISSRLLRVTFRGKGRRQLVWEHK